jgi:hypothetical protein
VSIAIQKHATEYCSENSLQFTVVNFLKHFVYLAWRLVKLAFLFENGTIEICPGLIM